MPLVMDIKICCVLTYTICCGWCTEFMYKLSKTICKNTILLHAFGHGHANLVCFYIQNLWWLVYKIQLQTEQNYVQQHNTFACLWSWPCQLCGLFNTTIMMVGVQNSCTNSEKQCATTHALRHDS